MQSVDRETSSDVLEKVKEICAESNLGIPDSNLDTALRIGKSYFHKIKKVKCKGIIVCFNCCTGQERVKTEERVQNQIRFDQKALFNAFWSK